MTGAIPAELGGLTNLQSLSLAGNELGGPLPVELGSLPNLSALTLRITLDGNEFTGCIPDGLRDVERNNLHRLALRYCGTPDVPPPASDWPVLVALYETMGGGANWANNDNWLSEAPIGVWSGVTTDANGRVTRLVLFNNNLSGPIPGELLGKLSALEALSLLGNELSGPIPAELGMLSSLEVLVLSSNRLSGSIPAELGMLSNQLSGSIPAELAMLSSLERLSLLGNELSGRIPVEFGQPD